MVILIRPMCALLIALLSLAGCKLWETEHWHQKVTVEVETPDGLITGSSVQRIDYSKANLRVPDGPSSSLRPTGEAVVVDLGTSGKLFALLKGETHLGHAGRFAIQAFSGDDRRTTAKSPGESNTIMSLRGSTAQLHREAYPQLVTFTDIDNPDGGVRPPS